MVSVPICYIVDADPLARATLRDVVAAMEVEIAEFATVEQFLAEFDPRRLGCLVVAMHMPGESSLDLLRRLKEQRTEIAPIVIGRSATVADAVQAMKAGAVDFLERPFSTSLLRNSIQRALAQQQQQRANHRAAEIQQQKVGSLTDDELAVVWLTAAGDPDKRIAAKLDISTRTVQLRRASAMKKLNVQSRVDVVRLVGATPSEFWTPHAQRLASRSASRRPLPGK